MLQAWCGAQWSERLPQPIPQPKGHWSHLSTKNASSESRRRAGRRRMRCAWALACERQQDGARVCSPVRCSSAANCAPGRCPPHTQHCAPSYLPAPAIHPRHSMPEAHLRSLPKEPGRHHAEPSRPVPHLRRLQRGQLPLQSNRLALCLGTLRARRAPAWNVGGFYYLALHYRLPCAAKGCQAPLQPPLAA